MTPLFLPPIDSAVNLGDKEGTSASLYLAAIVVSWGNIQYELYNVLEASDPENWTTHASAFFSNNSTKEQRKLVIANVSNLFQDEPQIQKKVKDLMTQMSDLTDIRNLIVHGVWSGKRGNYSIQPLRWDKNTLALQRVRSITTSELKNFARSTELMRQRLAGFTGEVLAGWMLKRMAQNRRRSRGR